jgi:hypothetical protein
MEFLGHLIFQDLVFETQEYKKIELRVKGALVIIIEQDPYIIAIQKTISTINNRLRIITGIIQNKQATYT